jgi:sialic acid synthase SpsE
MKSFKIGNLLINHNKCLIIAEVGVNHNCNFKIAEKLIKEAKKNGADIVKFQTYKADKLSIKDSPQFKTSCGKLIKKGILYKSYQELDKFDSNDYKILKRICDKNKIEFMSTPFDNSAVDMLDNLGVKAFKVASCDITNFPLLKKIAKKKKPIFLSTGASNMNEIQRAFKFISKFNKKICLMHCTMNYPTKPRDVNLLALNEFKKKFKNIPLGFSDHSIGYEIAAASILLGVRVIEKHFTYNKNLRKSADHPISINSTELKKLRKNADLLIEASGNGIKRVLNSEKNLRKFTRRSLVAKIFIKKGEIIKESSLIPKRPGTGVPPNLIQSIIGKKAKKNIFANQILKKEDFFN